MIKKSLFKGNLKKSEKLMILVTLIILGMAIKSYASYLINANQVSYHTKDGNNIALNAAIDEIYAKSREVETFLGYTGNTKATDLQVGDRINYYYAKGTAPIPCVVLYNDNTRGIQVVSADTVGSDITLGKTDPKLPSSMSSATDFEKATWSYNNAVYTLNSYAMDYVPEGGMAVDGRCVGSNPLIGKKNISETVPMFTSSESYMSSYNGKFKSTDTEYQTDYNQMKSSTLNIHKLGKEYWLASRSVYSYSGGSYFYVRNVYLNGSANRDYDLCYVRSNREHGQLRLFEWVPPGVSSKV